MFPSAFCIFSCHISQGQGLMDTQSLPDSLRDLLLREWCSSSILSPSSHTYPTNSPRHPWKQGALIDYLPLQSLLFWFPLAFGRATLFISSLLAAFSQGYVFFILNFKGFQGRICVSQKSSICLKCSDLAVTITKQ